MTLTIETPVQATTTLAKIALLKSMLEGHAKIKFPEDVIDYAKGQLRDFVRELETQVADYEMRVRQGDPSRLAGK